MEPIKASMVALFNTSTDYEQFLGAALIPALLHILAMTAGAWAVGRELRDRSIGEWLGASPRWHEALAALSRPSRLAEKFITMWPVAGWSFGTSGKMREKKGEMIFASLSRQLFHPRS